MKRAIYFLLAALLLTGCGAQKQVIGFYNLENLFDTLHDEGKNDAQYLPDGQNEWTQEKYAAKLTNMASVIRAMRDANGQYHALLGVAEVENEHVLRDLVAQPSIADARYGIVHYESPDSRGIDVALLYRPDVFEVLESKPLPFDFNSDIEFDYSPEEQAAFRTRDILMVRGKLAGRMTAVFVAHLPSGSAQKDVSDLPYTAPTASRRAFFVKDHSSFQAEMGKGVRQSLFGVDLVISTPVC